MVRHYFDLKYAINIVDDATAALMSTRREENQLEGIFEELEDKALVFTDRALIKRKLQCETPCEYPEIAVTPPLPERFFSHVKHVLGSHRQELLPINLEVILFLMVNRHLWNVNMVVDVVNASN
ncbi:hypothetical protein JG688_00014190 [Phytophthora aleatoria]|uniref:HAT C-terminal dimerisation domain-containing protein n=1 Tax=Phytophthora aleatoria TaxID=2496075 RepID=A0A8J5M0L6_9STRA|nr:hypothetical protein JG688_00014190 [Phytophthora aleatoria]